MTREAAHAARRYVRASAAFAAASTPDERLRCAYDWFRAAGAPERTVDALAQRLARIAARLDTRAARGRSGGSDSAEPRATETPGLHAIARDRARGAV